MKFTRRHLTQIQYLHKKYLPDFVYTREEDGWYFYHGLQGGFVLTYEVDEEGETTWVFKVCKDNPNRSLMPGTISSDRIDACFGLSCRLLIYGTRQESSEEIGLPEGLKPEYHTRNSFSPEFLENMPQEFQGTYSFKNGDWVFVLYKMQGFVYSGSLVHAVTGDMHTGTFERGSKLRAAVFKHVFNGDDS